MWARQTRGEKGTTSQGISEIFISPRTLDKIGMYVNISIRVKTKLIECSPILPLYMIHHSIIQGALGYGYTHSSRVLQDLDL